MKFFLPLLFLVLSFFIFSNQVSANSSDLYSKINQKVCDRFEKDLVKMSSIMDELRRRKGITETRVAFGGIDTPIKSADYQITYAAEALAYQKAQKFSSKQDLKYSLQVLANKILKAKAEVKKALND